MQHTQLYWTLWQTGREPLCEEKKRESFGGNISTSTQNLAIQAFLTLSLTMFLLMFSAAKQLHCMIAGCLAPFFKVKSLPINRLEQDKNPKKFHMNLRHPHFKSESSRIKSNNPKIVIFQFNGKPKTSSFWRVNKTKTKRITEISYKIKDRWELVAKYSFTCSSNYSIF